MSYKENDIFKLPIEYIKDKREISNNIKTDLELQKNIENESKPIYNYIFNPKTKLGNVSLKKWSKYYTTNTTFLKESQKLYKQSNQLPFEKPIIENMIESWENIKKQNNFLEKYQFVDFQRFKWLNKSAIFLAILSFYNISAPIIQLIAPLFILILPFFLIKMMNLPITWNTYYKILKTNLQNHAVGKLFFSFKSATLGNKLYIIFAASMFFWNIYQNVLSCYRFYINTHFITQKFEIINNYLDYTIEKMTFYQHLTKNYKSYSKFNTNLHDYINKLKKFHNNIRNLPKNAQNFSKITNIGNLMKYFFILYDDKEIENIMQYSFGFHGYIDTIKGINDNLINNKIHLCKYSKKFKFKLKNMYHPTIQNPIKNSIDLKKNIIITGPNAAGKTTTIKATIINIILTQQIGVGFFDGCTTSTFDFIHCYLNIPDTCSRDSLFQAESRRCKHILDCIKDNPNKKHFCIFDELYSGTNPYEAISSAYSYLTYISKFKKVRFLLTTHYIQLCSLFNDNNLVSNKSMKTTLDKYNDPQYTYKISNGISSVKGGVSVLKKLNYPSKIINMTADILDKI
jgi:hypothetical protein